MTKLILISLGFIGKLVTFSPEYKSWNMFEKNININCNIGDLEVLLYCDIG